MSLEEVKTEYRRAAKTTRLFTVESANKALVYVRRIVLDVVSRYAQLEELQAEYDHRRAAALPDGRIAELRDEMDSVVRTLAALNDEIAEVGCELKDWGKGLIDFPAMHDGRRVCLCWQPDEPEVSFWHEDSAGFAGRRRIDADFGASHHRAAD